MNSIREAAGKRILIAAHRGVSGGNIPCNTLQAYEIALRQGADIVEIDVAQSLDGELFVFHPGMEFPHLRSEKPLSALTAEEIRQLRFVNQDGTVTACGISPLDEVLELLKGRCLVNIDKFWTAMPAITAAVRRHGMEQQVIVKTAADERWFSMVEEIAPDLPYMPIIKNRDTVTNGLLRRGLSLLGAEVLFGTEEDETASPAYIQRMHENGLLLWANAIVYDYRAVLSAGHTDDISLTDDPQRGWGWLADRGYDIVQTDWTLPLRLYYEQTGRR